MQVVKRNLKQVANKTHAHNNSKTWRSLFKRKKLYSLGDNEEQQ